MSEQRARSGRARRRRRSCSASSPTRCRSTISRAADDRMARLRASLAAWSFLLAGLIAWCGARTTGSGRSWSRPASRSSCGSSGTATTRSRSPFFLLGELGYALVAHVALAYPSGRVTDRARASASEGRIRRRARLPARGPLFYDGNRRLRYFDPSPRESLLLVSERRGRRLRSRRPSRSSAYGVLATLFVALIVRKLVRATPRARRISLAAADRRCRRRLRAVLDSILTFAATPPASSTTSSGGRSSDSSALPIALLAGALRARLARVHVGELVVHLEETPVDGIRDELAVALDDPTLELGLWLPERRRVRRRRGARVPVPDDGPTRRHEDRARRRAARRARPRPDAARRAQARGGRRAAARLALVNARLAAEVRAQLDTVKESRAGSSPLPTKSADGSSATSTTAPSSGSSRSRSSSGAPQRRVGEGGSRARAIARVDGRRAPGCRRGAPRARPWHPPGGAHAGGTCARRSRLSRRACRCR